MATDGLSILDALQEPSTANRPALVENGIPTTYRELANHVELRAAQLAAEGIALGSRVAMRATCDANTVVTFFALLELGAVLVPLHPRLTDAEVASITEDARPDLVLDL